MVARSDSAALLAGGSARAGRAEERPFLFPARRPLQLLVAAREPPPARQLAKTCERRGPKSSWRRLASPAAAADICCCPLREGLGDDFYRPRRRPCEASPTALSRSNFELSRPEPARGSRGPPAGAQLAAGAIAFLVSGMRLSGALGPAAATRRASNRRPAGCKWRATGRQ